MQLPHCDNHSVSLATPVWCSSLVSMRTCKRWITIRRGYAAHLTFARNRAEPVNPQAAQRANEGAGCSRPPCSMPDPRLCSARCERAAADVCPRTLKRREQKRRGCAPRFTHDLEAPLVRCPVGRTRNCTQNPEATEWRRDPRRCDAPQALTAKGYINAERPNEACSPP